MIARNKKYVAETLHENVEGPSQDLRLVAHIPRDDERIRAVAVA